MTPAANFCFLDIHMEKHVAIARKKDEKNGKVHKSDGPFNDFENEEHRSDSGNADNREYFFPLFSKDSNIERCCKLIFRRIFKENVIDNKKPKNKWNNSNVRD